MFILKKIISTLIMPLPFLLLVGVIGLCVLWFTRRKKLASILVSISLIGIFLCSFQPLTTFLLRPLEQENSAFVSTTKPISYVMVLGNDQVIDKTFPITSELSQTAIARLVEGIRIFRMYPGAKLILSGYGGIASHDISHARLMAHLAIALGVNKRDILLFESTKDTKEEAFQAADVVKDKNMILVTSASQMSRALYYFHQAGLQPIAAPTNFRASNNIRDFVPDSTYLTQMEIVEHERLGQLWQRITRLLLNSKTEHSQAEKAKHETL
ncbi:envelope biogenesis factor ElyC [Photobacterium carnosum]|uniref:envelope biogenesis factor ElyC n=1 Tax=Photobacterium carnosum TaxID=2023717 RepID=UPI001C918DAC|nr:envelope biogenesis factor ElyC [Photobacterium carnosum]MBY3786950.1 envelope biogenesis factor ElyC [Photobacterium carnosum]MCD9532843.1 envelope biogenesis factor ElyC [Photobacterium carnosum]